MAGLNRNRCIARSQVIRSACGSGLGRTTRHPVGMLSQRWAYHESPDSLPTVEFQKVALQDLWDSLPRGTARVTPEERREQVRMRQGHVQRRFGN